MTTPFRRALASAAAIGVLGVAAIAVSAPAAHAVGTTITVTTTADDNSVDGNCSLREAIDAADTDTTVDACPAGNGADTIALGAHTYAVHSGWLDIQSDVAIHGAAAASTVIDDTGTTCATCKRTVLVSAGAHLSVSGVTVLDAATAFRVQGTLDLDDSSITTKNNAPCGTRPRDEAGAIHNQGTVHLHNVAITHTLDTIFNALPATFDADGLTMSNNGPCDEGQSIDNLGTMTLSRATFDADVPGYWYAASIANQSTGTLTIDHSHFLHNTGGWASAVISNDGRMTISDSAFDRNENVPISSEGTATVVRTRFSTNHMQFYAPGAIYNGGQLELVDSTIDHNIGSVAGGLVNATSDAHATLVNDTIVDNVALNTGRVYPGQLPSGGVTNGAVMMLRNVTIARNHIIGFHDWRYHAGGIVTMPHGYTALSNSIVADNVAQAPVRDPDCFGEIHSLGYDLVERLIDCNFDGTITGNVYAQSAHLRALAANGGPTLTSLPPWDSPAVDTANPATPTNSNATTCAQLDQRGVARPRDGNANGTSRCDIGAVER